MHITGKFIIFLELYLLYLQFLIEIDHYILSLLRMCLSIKREHYPEYEMLSGHTVNFSPPLSVLNLLPVDAEFRIVNRKYAVSASKQIQITSVSVFIS